MGNHLCDVRQVVIMYDEAEMHQLMLERMQMLEEALRRGIAGIATEDDWELIYAECGLPKSLKTTPETASLSRSE